MAAAAVDEDKRWSLMIAALKAADIGHLARPTEVHRGWVEAIQEEFWLQGDREAAMGIMVSPMCDRQGRTLLHFFG